MFSIGKLPKHVFDFWRMAKTLPKRDKAEPGFRSARRAGRTRARTRARCRPSTPRHVVGWRVIETVPRRVGRRVSFITTPGLVGGRSGLIGSNQWSVGVDRVNFCIFETYLLPGFWSAEPLHVTWSAENLSSSAY